MTRFGRTAVLAAAWFAAVCLALAPVAAQAAGALAVGKCGTYGFAYDFKGEQAARSAALKKCSGAECKVVTAMRRNCAALAVDGRNFCGSYGFAAAARLGPAQNSALQQCYRYGGKDCVIRAFVCDAKG
jgi:hypothetical protein